MFGVPAKVLRRYLYHRCSYFSVMAMIGDVALKIRQPLKKDGGKHSLVGEGPWGTNENIINILNYFSFCNVGDGKKSANFK